MAVNKITNKQVVNRESVNRANEVSTKSTTIRGNRETTIIPGNNFSENYSITLKDVDTAILNHVKNVIKPQVKEANEIFKIPVYYGNEERWKAVRKRGVIRDKNGSLNFYPETGDIVDWNDFYWEINGTTEPQLFAGHPSFKHQIKATAHRSRMSSLQIEERPR